MNKQQHFIYDRGVATGDVQTEIQAAWIWPGKPVADWETELNGIDAQDTAAAAAQAAVKAARGNLDAKLEVLHNKNQQALAMLKTKFRNNSAKLALLDGLVAIGGSRPVILEEARDFEPVWEAVDATFVPITGNTLAIFKTTRQDAIGLMNALKAAEVAAKEQEEEVAKLINAMEDSCVAFYSDACHVFAPDTTEGALIRSQIPTTYNPTLPPLKAVIESASFTAPMAVKLQYHADHASRYDIYQKSPGQTEFALIADNVTEHSYDADLEAGNGEYSFQVIGKNAEADGPVSDPVMVTAPGTP